MMKLDTRYLSVLIIVLLFLLSGCQGNDEGPTAAAEVAVTEAITPSPDPTDTSTPEPSDTPTPEPTETPLPTETPTPEPTDTPTPKPSDTPTPKPTETPSPTETPLPEPTAAPEPTSTSAPTVPTATQEPEATETAEEFDTLVIYYLSNPDEILGVFPVQDFDGNGLYNNMLRIRNSLDAMRGALEGARHGDAAACATYTQAYDNILYSGVFYDPVPPEWQEVDEIYFISFVYSLDRTRPAYLSCLNAGHVDQFNGDLAAAAFEQTLSILNPAIAMAAGMQ
jgi:hypothetical protein